MAREHRRLALPVVEFGVWARPLSEGGESGDSYLVKPSATGVLLAVADGLGHGEQAAAASRTAMSCLEAYASQSVIALFQFSHAALKRTRGVVMSLAFFDRIDSTMTWLGVGNVGGVLIRADSAASPSREFLLLRGGVVGFSLPQLYAAVMPIAPGDTLLFATDGIASSFADLAVAAEPPHRIAERIGAQFYTGTDDALVVAGRYRGQ